MTSFLTTVWSASLFSSDILSRAIRWSSNVFRRLFLCFLFLSFAVKPVSSSSCRSSSEKPPSRLAFAIPSLPLMVDSLSSDIFGSSMTNCPLTEGPLTWPFLPVCGVELLGDIRLLRRRRWPAGVMGSISILSAKELVLEAATASETVALLARAAALVVRSEFALDRGLWTPNPRSLLVAWAGEKDFAGEPDLEESAEDVVFWPMVMESRGKAATASGRDSGRDSGRGVFFVERDGRETG